jgi:hypothetical protein
MRTVNLTELQDILRQAPVMVEIHPLSLAFLSEDVRLYADAWQMAAALDMPTPQPTEPMLAIGIESSLLHRLPAVRCAHDPLTTELNRVLLKRYEVIRANMLCQSQLADRIVREADAETIILMLVDGLAYADVKRCAPEVAERYDPCFGGRRLDHRARNVAHRRRADAGAAAVRRGVSSLAGLHLLGARRRATDRPPVHGLRRPRAQGQVVRRSACNRCRGRTLRMRSSKSCAQDWIAQRIVSARSRP